MSGKKIPGKPKLPKVSTYVVVRFRTEKLVQCLLPLSCWFNKSLLWNLQ